MQLFAFFLCDDIFMSEVSYVDFGKGSKMSENRNVCELLKKLSFESDPIERQKLQDLQQSLIDQTSSAEFEAFNSDRSAVSGNLLLNFYDSVLDRILSDVPATVLNPGEVAVWYIYNHGWIIKTSQSCFGIDVHHRRADELAEILDFVAVTHNHNDHYNMELLRSVGRAGKLVISNFFPNPGYTKEVSFTHRIKDITIHCGEADHNTILHHFTMPMEIVCAGEQQDFVFFTSGDCYSSDFLERRSSKINLYAIHPRCGMLPVDAAKKLQPEMTFVVHLQEMGHDIGRWRWTMDDGRLVIDALAKENFNAYLPAWGEKFFWDGKKLHLAQR